MWRGLALLALCVACGRVDAAYSYAVQVIGGTGGTPAAACAAAASQTGWNMVHLPPYTNTYPLLGGTCAWMWWPGDVCLRLDSCNAWGISQIGTPDTCSPGVTPDPITGTCPPPPCQSGMTMTGVGPAVGGCFGGCSYQLAGQGISYDGELHGQFASTGGSCQGANNIDSTRTCSGEMPLALQPIYCSGLTPCPEGQYRMGANCVAFSDGCVDVGGETVCANADQNCIVVNGQRICAQDEPGEREGDYCVESANGTVVCITGTRRTETSSETTRTTNPDGTTTETTVETRTNNETGTTTTTTTTVQRDQDGNETAREVVEETSGDEEDSYASAPADWEWPDIEAQSWSELTQGFSDRWAQLAWVQGLGSFADVAPSCGGTCPAFVVPLFGSQIGTTAHCETWESVASTLSVVMTAIWTIVAIRIFLSA